MKTTYEFQTLEESVKPFPKRRTFMEAWNDMFLHVNAMIKAGQASLCLIETALWIEVKEPGKKYPIMFCDARDKAIRDFGWKKPATAGFTLLELLVCIAILGGIALSIAALVVGCHFIGKAW